MEDEVTQQAAAELAAAVAEQLLGEGWLPPSGPLPEWRCPSCGATTRAQLADKVPSSRPPAVVRVFRYAKSDGPVYRAYPDGRVTRNSVEIDSSDLAYCEASVLKGAMIETMEAP